MIPKIDHLWNLSPEKAEELQIELSKLVIKEDRFNANFSTISGVDIHYQKNSNEVIAGVVVLDRLTFEIIDCATAKETVTFPYIPGLFSFREIPPIIEAMRRLKTEPEILVCDGQGYAHPRRFGLACHLGVLFDLPTIGCGKSRYIGEYQEPGQLRGEHSPLLDNGETIGTVLRTQDGIKPIFVSVGHKVNLVSTCNLILENCPHFRLPETTRMADHLVRTSKEL